MNAKKLDAGHKHTLKLMARDAGPEGWSLVSEVLYEVLRANTPTQLAEFEKLETGGRCRLTRAGQEVVNAMEWL